MSPERVLRGWQTLPVRLTSPARWRGTVVCNDDCEHCPLFQQGCAGRCLRWHDKVCADCPCLGSAYAEVVGAPTTVDPADAGKQLGVAGGLLQIREVNRARTDNWRREGLQE